MKGIKCCAECADYSMKKHKCTRGVKDPGKATDSFYADCPLVDAQPLRCGRWILKMLNIGGDDKIRMLQCSECSRYANMKFDFCPNCGARMDAGDDQSGGAENAVT